MQLFQAINFNYTFINLQANVMQLYELCFILFQVCHFYRFESSSGARSKVRNVLLYHSIHTPAKQTSEPNKDSFRTTIMSSQSEATFRVIIARRNLETQIPSKGFAGKETKKQFFWKRVKKARSMFWVKLS